MKPLKLTYNRVWRTYTGGKAIDNFYNNDNPTDGHYPEVWIASTVTAVNPDFVENEGLSKVEGQDAFLIDLIKENPAGYLGQAHADHYGAATGVLVKLLDAAERLTIQVHPDNHKAMELFDSRFGKTEAWYVMEGREIDGDAPHIFLGFKEGIKREEWVTFFEDQNIEGMLGCMHKIYVNPGDVYLIEGGTPHAIGAGCCIVEIQEPTDLTIRIEKVTPGGYEIPDRICHQGLGFERMFDCFNYEGYSEQAVRDKWQLVDGSKPAGPNETLIGYEQTTCFSLESVSGNWTMEEHETFAVLFALEGDGEMTYDGGSFSVSKGDQIFIPAETAVSLTVGDSGLKMMRCLPPKTSIK